MNNTALLIILSSVLLLNGCTNYIRISSKPLQPLIDPIDATIALNLSDNFKKLKLKQRNAENTRTRRTFLIGSAQRLLFSNLIDALSAHSQFEIQRQQIQPDITIQPILKKFKISDPSSAKNNNYEVWLTYSLIMENTQSKYREEWTIMGYGKVRDNFFKSDDRAFNQATQKALRQIGTQFLTQYSQHKLFKTLR